MFFFDDAVAPLSVHVQDAADLLSSPHMSRALALVASNAIRAMKTKSRSSVGPSARVVGGGGGAVASKSSSSPYKASPTCEPPARCTPMRRSGRSSLAMARALVSKSYDPPFQLMSLS